jgi:hypothetical protein
MCRAMCIFPLWENKRESWRPRDLAVDLFRELSFRFPESIIFSLSVKPTHVFSNYARTCDEKPPIILAR